MPTTKLIWAIFEPTKAPTAMSGTFLIPEIIAIYNSGIELPIEIMLRPITNDEIRVYLAILLAPNTNRLAANNSKLKANIKLVIEPKM